MVLVAAQGIRTVRTPERNNYRLKSVRLVAGAPSWAITRGDTGEHSAGRAAYKAPNVQIIVLELCV